MPTKFCGYSRCGKLIPLGERFCPEHKHFQEGQRGKASERGYDWRWKKFRDWFLSRHVLCELCEIKKIVKAADEVHHRIPLKGKHDPNRLVESNCMPLCGACHRQVTLEQRAIGGEKSFTHLPPNQA